VATIVELGNGSKSFNDGDNDDDDDDVRRKGIREVMEREEGGEGRVQTPLR